MTTYQGFQINVLMSQVRIPIWQKKKIHTPRRYQKGDIITDYTKLLLHTFKGIGPGSKLVTSTRC